jgi:iron complex transport system substrate-binding protein
MTKRFLCLALCLWAVPIMAQVKLTASIPRRIVSLTPANTEMLFALGLGNRVVGDTNYCNYPAAAISPKIAKIGGIQVNYERVAALRPDLIVGDSVATPEADARLTQLGFRVLALHPASISGVEQSIFLLGQQTGETHQAKSVVAGMEAKRRIAHLLAAHDPRHLRVLIVVGTSPLYVAGRGTFMDSILTEAGGVNAAQITGYGTLSPETALARPPDLVLANPSDEKALQADPVLRFIPAVRRDRFVSLGNGNLFERPGPRITDGLLILARALHALSASSAASSWKPSPGPASRSTLSQIWERVAEARGCVRASG